VTESGSVTSSAYVFSNPEIAAFFNLTFQPGTSTNIAGPGHFIIEFPHYDIGWIPTSNTIACKLGDNYYPCTRYDIVDWVVIPLPAGVTFSTGTTITLMNLRYPRYEKSGIGPLVRFISAVSSHETVNRPQEFLPVPTIPTFIKASLIANKKAKGMVDCEYRLTFASKNEIPEGSSLVITFPTGYNLLTSYPPVEFYSPELVDISPTQKVSYIPSVQTLTITNYQTIPEQTSIQIFVKGLKNPSNLAMSETWRAELYFGTHLMIYHDDFDKFTFTPALSSGTITFNSIEAFPMNANAYADYTISFVPATKIPVGGEIRITFPSANYPSLPTPPVCKVSGGITTYKKCVLSGYTYVIELDEEYSTGTIEVKIYNILNPAQGTTSGFVVRTYYDGVFLDNTDSSDLTGRTITLLPAAENIAMKSLSFDPRNEGEPATYTFTFLPESSLYGDIQIRIIFPSVYDALLGTRVYCDATSGLTGELACTVSNRVVTITGFDSYTPDSDNPITINVYGVTNPNRNIQSDTGQFTIAIYKKNTNYYIGYNANAGALVMEPAPGWSILYNISATNLYTRLNSDYKFNITTTAAIPKQSSKGAILIDLPTDFDVADSSLTCTPVTTSFAASLTCNVKSNKITVVGNPNAYTGNIIFTVHGVENPVEPGLAGNIRIKTYDGFNKLIVERSFRNLDPFTFTYTYPGPLITVNNEQPIRVERGTQTQDLYITLDYPSALNLTLKPYTPGFSVIPYTLDLSLGKIKVKFRVSVPENFPDGTYYIEWQTLNELTPPYYTPIKKTQVIVTKLKSKI